MNLAAIPAFASDDIFHVVVEAPRGSTLKLRYEPQWEAMSVSRPLPLGVTYPFDWGFVPSTRAADGDPLDAMLLWDVSSYPSVVVPCRAIGVMHVEQNRTNHNPADRIRNDRIMSMPVAARREHTITDLAALPARVAGIGAVRGCGDRPGREGRARRRLERRVCRSEALTGQCDAMRCEDAATTLIGR